MVHVRRRRTDGVSQRASTLELFYDLVFVFAITQVSHLLLEPLTWGGAGQALIVLLAVWWSWNYTTWTTNELDTETIPVRLLLRRDPGGTARVPYVRRGGARDDGAGTRRENPHLVRGGRCAVDSGRLGGRVGTNGSVARRS